MILAAFVPGAQGIILLSTGDPNANTTTPGDNSGWQYEGQFDGFIGTPIAPRYFITANHIGGSVGDVFTFHGETFTTNAAFADTGTGATDLKIWQVDHAFATWAPLYTAGQETGQEVRVMGRGTQRGAEVMVDGQLKGWQWGQGDGRQRWGRNQVSGVTSVDVGSYLYCNFDSPGLASEAHLSVGDSGGGEFILDKGLWKLTATNYGVDDLFTAPADNTSFAWALFDGRGYYNKDNNGAFYLVTGEQNVPTAFYGTRVSQRLDWIKSVIGSSDLDALPPETFNGWLHGYFTPAQLADQTVTGPAADPDGDGLNNLQEYAFNLDPTFAEVTVMMPDTGIRGLPLVRLESGTGGDTHLTVEYVRRATASGSGLTYTVQFTSDLAASNGWRAEGTEAATSINARWERVKVTDSVAVGGGATQRFARVVVSTTDASGALTPPVHTSNNSRLGSSIQSLIRTKAVTASLPSTTR